MAIFHARTTPLSRRSGRSAVAAAAYRAGCRLVDARTGREHDYTRKRGVEASALILPDGESIDRELLWSAAERVEARKDARTAREWVLALPSELSASERVELVHAFALELARHYGVAVDVAIHAPHRHGDERNYHAHLLCTTRRVERDPALGIVLGEKAEIELSDTRRRKAGLSAASDEITHWRASWAKMANGALERAGRSERIDHRSLRDQGIDREPTLHLGPVATQMERRGRESDRGRILRAIRRDNREREQLAARLAWMQVELAARERAAQEQAERERAERERAEREAREAAERAAQERAAQAERDAREKAELEREYHEISGKRTTTEKERLRIEQLPVRRHAKRELDEAAKRLQAARQELLRVQMRSKKEQFMSPQKSGEKLSDRVKQLLWSTTEKTLENQIEILEVDFRRADLELSRLNRSIWKEAEKMAGLNNRPIRQRMDEILGIQKKRLRDVAFNAVRTKYAGPLRFSDDRDLNHPLKVLATIELGMLSDRNELHCAVLVAADGSHVIRPLYRPDAADLSPGKHITITRDRYGHESVRHIERERSRERERERDRGGRGR